MLSFQKFNSFSEIHISSLSETDQIKTRVETKSGKDTPISNEIMSSADYISLHNNILLSGKYNFESCRVSLNHRLKIDFFRFMLLDYSDNLLCEFLEFGFPIGYFGKHQSKNSDIRSVKNHKGAKEFPAQVIKYLKKRKILQCYFRAI